MVARYNFQRFPDPAAIAGETQQTIKLQTGDFNGIQINELSVYSDGIIVEAGADTDIVEAFIDDFYGFLAETFSIVRLEVPAEARHYDGAIVVEMDKRVAAKFDFLDGLYNDLADFRQQYGFDDKFAFYSLRVETDPASGGSAGGPKFSLERRTRVPFAASHWFSNAPLKTQDHVAVLENLEKQLLR